LVDCDDARRRLVYAAISERIKQHSASVQVVADGDARSRLIWIADVLPNEIALTSTRRWIRQRLPCRRRWDATPHDDVCFSRCARCRRSAADRAGKMELYGRFVGSWELMSRKSRMTGRSANARAMAFRLGAGRTRDPGCLDRPATRRIAAW